MASLPDRVNTEGGAWNPTVTVPTEVRFDHQVRGNRDMFCFAATAAGWHMGALAIDLEVKLTGNLIVTLS